MKKRGTYRRRSLQERFWKKVKKVGDCWLWIGSVNASGYGMIGVYPYKMKLAHRVSWEWMNGTVPKGLYICHHCNTPACVRPSHLYSGIPTQNSLDAARHRGPKLSVEVMREIQALDLAIRRREHRYLTQNEIGSRYGVSGSHIGSIVNGRASGIREHSS